MDWGLYWTIILQLVIACAILAMPISFVAYFISSGAHSGQKRSDTTVPKEWA